LNKQLTRVATAIAILFVFLVESSVPVAGQGVGVYRGMQRRRVGRVTLPTPPFNPNAGILDSRGGRGHDSPNTALRRQSRSGVKAANRNPYPGTPRRRRVRRGRNTHPGTSRKMVSRR
jgi:hypothetical protein